MLNSPVILTVGTSCTEPGTEKEFARWYKEVHVAEVKLIPGMLDATFLENIDRDDKDSPGFLAIWELENEQAVQTFKDHLRRQRKKEIPDFVWGPKFDIKWFKFFRKTQ